MDLQVIPDSWAATNLGSIVDYGKTQKCELADIDDVTWVVELEDIEKDTSRIISRGYTPARDFKSSKNIFNKGDILYGKLRPYLNKVVMADENGVCSTEIIPINAEPLVINKYIFYWVKSHRFLDYVNDVSYGVNMPRLGTSDGLNAPFILAPFAEQKEIVDRLDKLLAQVEVTQARLARIPDIIKQFSQSVLAAAVSGKLTEEWRKKNNANFTFHETKILNLIKKDKYSLAIGPFGSNLKTSDYKDKGVPLVFVREIRGDCFGDDKTKYIEEGKFNELKAHAITPGDILVTKMGSPPGDVTIYPEGRPDAVITADCIKISVDDTAYDKKYILFAMKSPLFKDRVVNISAGVAQQKVNLKRFRELSIPVPFIDEQTEIVRRVEQLFAYADSIEQQAKAAKERVDKLTQAILAKAFRGELTADWRAANPVLISGDNSAAALLARIQAERATVKPRKRASKSAISPTSSGVTQ
ncbi:restriction endonuclease subunit S [Aeromonas hydrophila]|uniref:restriction endonuclease subunit S n=1 Tax=Aeromonas hydrophila TaxID=644 RepID=UPI002B474768|nr:restriction endonuclease subunit S [Aeromonas hydrophila]